MSKEEKVTLPSWVSEISIFFLSMAIILLAASELLSSYYGKTMIIIEKKRLRTIALIFIGLFVFCAGILIFDVVTSVL